MRTLALAAAMALVGCATLRPLAEPSHEAYAAPVFQTSEVKPWTLPPGALASISDLPPLQLEVFGQGVAPLGVGNCSTPSAACSVAALTSAGAISGTTLTTTGAIAAGGTVASANGAFEASAASGVLARLNGRASDGASAVAVALDNYSTFSTSGAKQLSVRNFGTEKAYVDMNGSYGFAVSATLRTCGSGLEGLLSRDATGGTGAVYTKICACRYDGTTYKWFNAFNPSVTTGTTTTCPN